MGLFDIFRRKKREEVDQSTEATAPVSAATSPQDQAPVAEASSATTLDQPASEKEETTSAAPVEEAGAETAAPKADDQGEVAPEKMKLLVLHQSKPLKLRRRRKGQPASHQRNR